KAKVRVWTDSLRRIETCGKPVVAAATGTALGGGLEVMLACHHRIAAENPKARFGFPEVMLGLLPGAGGTQRTARLIGIAAALPLLLDGTRLTAAQAHEAGLLDAVVPPGDLLSAARAALLAGRVPAANPWDDRRFRPPGLQPGSVAALDHFVLLNGRVHAERGTCDPAPRAILSAVFEGARLPIARGLEVELDYFTDLVQGDVAQAMIATTFFARRAAAKGGWPAPDTEGPLVQRLSRYRPHRAIRTADGGRARAAGVDRRRGAGLLRDRGLASRARRPRSRLHRLSGLDGRAAEDDRRRGRRVARRAAGQLRCRRARRTDRACGIGRTPLPGAGRLMPRRTLQRAH
ncbi:MAG: hypothetical protein CVT80_13100, partial [Alphaproteobacteria bacterium HGW-Alphaproteobacteria-2]